MRKTLMILLFVMTAVSFVSMSSREIIWGFSFELGSSDIAEERIRSEITLDDDFIGGEIMVVLNRQATFRFENYSIESFPELSLSKVEDITRETSIRVEEQLSKLTEYDISRVRNNSLTINADSSIEIDSFRRILRLELKDASRENTLRAIRLLEQRGDVVSAEPNSFGKRLAVTPNDPQFNLQWAVDRVGLRQAWGLTTGSSNINVGIIDSGIQANHPDLVNRVNLGLSRDFTLPYPHIPSSVTDIDGHGTMVAGVVGAQGNNGIGITGVCWDVRLVSLKDGDDVPNVAAATQAIIFATNNNINVLNISSRFVVSNAMTAAINNFRGIVVVAAGNHGTYGASFPASLSATNLRVISVGASDQSDRRASFSAYSNRTVTIFAPGVSIRTTINSTYITESGTSLAAPHVAGAIALIMSHRPNLSNHQIRNAIINSANRNVSSDIQNGSVAGGILNVYGALRIAEVPASQSILGPTTASVFSQVTLTVNPALRPRHIEWRINYNNLMWSYQPGSNTIRIIGIMPGTFHINAIVDGINFVHTIRFI